MLSCKMLKTGLRLIGFWTAHMMKQSRVVHDIVLSIRGGGGRTEFVLLMICYRILYDELFVDIVYTICMYTYFDRPDEREHRDNAHERLERERESEQDRDRIVDF